MSLDTTRIHCTGCDYEYFEHYRPIILKCRVKQGVATYYRDRAWCHRCGKITGAEALPTIEELRRYYEQRCGVPGPPVSWVNRIARRLDRSYRRNLEELEIQIAWRRARTAPARCLTCGSTHIEILNFVSLNRVKAAEEAGEGASEHTGGSIAHAVGFRHSCGGEFIHDHNDKSGSRFHFAEQVIWMDIEGNVLAKERGR